jgi:hypothetical protein
MRTKTKLEMILTTLPNVLFMLYVFIIIYQILWQTEIHS